jgi:two-component system, chemotaxis family, chemotaxis protein CheY
MLMEAMPITPPAAGRTVLVVDDVDDARDMMARLLRLGGYEPLTAEDGAAALAAVDSSHPDLVLLDYSMPDMDGLAVLRRLRADPRHRALPVMMFSAVQDPRTIAEARRLGAADFVVKGSVGSSDLLARIACQLGAAA